MHQAFRGMTNQAVQLRDYLRGQGSSPVNSDMACDHALLQNATTAVHQQPRQTLQLWQPFWMDKLLAHTVCCYSAMMTGLPTLYTNS